MNICRNSLLKMIKGLLINSIISHKNVLQEIHIYRNPQKVYFSYNSKNLLVLWCSIIHKKHRPIV